MQSNGQNFMSNGYEEKSHYTLDNNDIFDQALSNMDVILTSSQTTSSIKYRRTGM